jgi:hypothetical protein
VTKVNKEDIKIALQFLFCDDQPRVIFMQLPWMRDIPYAKRAIMQEIGEPDMSLANAMRYPGNKQIHFLSVGLAGANELHGRDEEQMFYISYAGKEDTKFWVGKMEQHEVPDAQIELWCKMGMGACEVLKALRVDGFAPRQCYAAVKACMDLFYYKGGLGHAR